MRVDQRKTFGDRNTGQISPATAWAVIFLFLGGCGRSTPSGTPPEPPDSTAGSTPDGAPSEGDLPATTSSDSMPPRETVAAVSSEFGKQLYARHCVACHGEQGEGKGIAAAYVFPKPRDFRAGRFRLVSTKNRVPTRQDMLAVLLRGMPGSSMPPWAHLSDDARGALVDEVIRMRRQGARDQYIRILKEQDDLTDEEIAAEDVQEEIESFVQRLSTPGESTEVPDIGAPTDETIARGKEVYVNFGCVACHGTEGKGDGVEEMIDDEKLPTSPRDFTGGIFKGGYDPASLYRRTAYGMPGTPMPSSSTMTPKQMVDLVHYIRSMSTEEQRRAAALNRETILASSVDAVPEAADADQWAQVVPVGLRMTPLWWRNDADPDLTVQAVHDGEQIAVRLTWRDGTEDGHAARSESFEDAVAMELYRGEAEPFLGMGDAESPVDVWFWDADRQGEPLAVEDLYPNTVVDQFPFSETVVASAELDRDGARTADQPEISLPARASGNAITPTDDPSGASSLAVGGPGTVTFRIPRSQLVEARGQWNEGRWSVVMTRKLSVASPSDGVSLEPGGRASVAFAVWDGSQQDRDGKKLITIWQDIELEN